MVVRPKPSSAVVGTTDNDWSADPRFEQANAAQDQRAHDPLSEIRFGYQQRPEPVRRDKQGLHGTSRVGVDQRRPSHQLRQFTHERAGMVGNDQLTASGVMVPCHVDGAGKNDAQAVACLADPDQGVAWAEGAGHAKVAHPLDLQRLEDGKHLVASCLGDFKRRSRS